MARVIHYEPAFLLFASDAEIMALWGVLCLVIAGVAMVMERRRAKRVQIHRVGWMPWTGVFLSFAVIGGGMLAMAVPAMLQS